jgi:hypothetical protein
VIRGVNGMWANLARVRFDRKLVDQAIGLVRTHLVPGFVTQPGSRYGYWMVDRTTGHAVVVTCWDNREAIEDSRAELGAARAMVMDELDALLIETGIYSVHACAGDGVPISGQSAWSRITFVEGLASEVDDPDDVLFRSALRRYEGYAGFLSMCWLVDAPSGNGLAIVTWDTKASRTASESASRRTRRHVERALRCRIDGVEEVETIAVATPVHDVLDLRNVVGAESSFPSATDIIHQPT